MANQTFVCSSAAGGIALIAPASGGGHPTLFNPAATGFKLKVKKLLLTYVSGNNAPGGVEWAYTLGCGAGPATGTPLLTATRVVPPNVVVGSPLNPQAIYWSPTTNTFTAAPTFLCGAGLSLFTGVATTAVAPFKLEVDYDDDELAVWPGAALSLCTDVATTTSLFQVTLFVEEEAIAA